MGDHRGARSSSRNQTIELLRILSCLGIVAFHAGVRGAQIGYAGLTVFLILTAYFEAASPRPTDIPALARKLLIPWVVATLAFGALDAIRHQPILSGDNPVFGLLYGTSPHLWYLPFTFGCLVLIGRLKANPKGLLYGASFVAVVMLLTCAIWRRTPLETPFVQYAQALAPICIGVVLALRARAEAKALGVVVAGALAFAVAANVPGVSLPYGLGAAAVVGCLLRPMTWNVQPISRHMFGVYLIHPAVLSFAHAAHLHGWAAVLAAFGLSLALVITASRLREGRKLQPLGAPTPATYQ